MAFHHLVADDCTGHLGTTITSTATYPQAELILPLPPMIRAILLYTGADGHSHFTYGSINEGALLKAERTLFKETAAQSTYDWHTAPVTQYVITLSGILEFETKSGATFTLHPGDILVATDTTGTGHKWKLINEEPWKRVYIVFEKGENTHFVADAL